MVDILTAALVGSLLLILCLLVAILLSVRRNSHPVSTHALSVELGQSMAPYLQVLQPLKQQADQRLPLIEKNTTDLGHFLLASHKQRQEEEKIIRESLAKLHEMTKQTPEVAKQISILQNEFRRMQGIEAGVQELTKLFLSTQGRGAMGEEAVRAQFHALPPDMWSEQYPLGNGKVDFVIHMPNKRVLPIDSKTSGLQPILEYHAIGQRILDATPGEEKEQLLREQGKLQTKIRQAVLAKTYEVAAYIQPEKGTLGVALQAVPDALYAILDIKTRKESSEQNVQIVPYGLLLPIIHILRSQNQYDRLDFQAVVAALQGVRLQTNAVREVLVHKFEKAHKVLSSGIEDVRQAVDSIDQNTENIGKASEGAGGSRLSIQQLRAKVHQKHLDGQ